MSGPITASQRRVGAFPAARVVGGRQIVLGIYLLPTYRVKRGSEATALRERPQRRAEAARSVINLAAAR